MNKNTILAFILMGVVLFGYSWFIQPTPEEIAERQKQDSILAVQRELVIAEEAQRQKAYESQIVSQQNDSNALFFNSYRGEGKQIVLKNDKIALTFDTKGGKLSKAVVFNYEDRHGNKDVTLFEGKEQNMNFILEGKDLNIISNNLYFTPSEVTDTTVTLTAPASNGGELRFRYVLGNDYMLRMSVQATGLADIFSPTYKEMSIIWTDSCRQQEKGHTFENRYATLTYKEKESGIDNLSEVSDEVDETLEEPLDWVAFKSQFFSMVLISKNDINKNAKMSSILQDKHSGYLKVYAAEMKTFFDPTGVQPTEFEFFIGPNDFQVLQETNEQTLTGKDLELQELVDLGWPLFRLINRWFTLYVFDWLTGFGLNMGIVLIILTIILKVITFPMVKKSYMSSAKMRVLRPKLEEATKQYNKPEDQMQKQQAMMTLYSQYGVSPLSGCLPMLIQMPIWIAMFNFVPNAIQLRGESFLWIDDLSTYDPIIEWGTDIWLIGDHLSLTCILFCITNILYTTMTMRQQRDQMIGQQASQMNVMKWMMYLMPVMFFFMFNDYSSGLNFYYFISLFCSAAIMWTLRKTTNDAKLLAILEERFKENQNKPKKTSGFAARLEAMQKQAEELKRQRKEQENLRRK